MSDRRRGHVIDRSLMILVNLLLGLCLWYGYQFADHVQKQLALHEKRIDDIAVVIAHLEGSIKNEAFKLDHVNN